MCFFNNDYITYSCVILKNWLNILLKRMWLNIIRFKVCLTKHLKSYDIYRTLTKVCWKNLVSFSTWMIRENTIFHGMCINSRGLSLLYRKAVINFFIKLSLIYCCAM